jgi:hypothetical protein
MESLLTSLKVSQSQASVAFYIFVCLLSVFSVACIFTLYIYLRNGGSFGTALQAAFPNIALNTILYVLAGLVLFMVLLMLFNSQYDVFFQRKTGGINRPMPLATTFWQLKTLDNPQDPVNLQITSEDFPMSTPEVYSMSLELNISDTRAKDDKGPYRHIIHRGTGELIDFVADSPGSIPKGRGDLNDGLPLQMNPGVFIDPYTNDLVIFVDTDPLNGTGQAFRESIRVADVPLKTPFRIHITVHDQILEVYINCRLANTKLLHGTPRAVPNDWYARIGFARSQSTFQNLNLWDSDLYATEIRKLCPPIDMPHKNALPTGAGCK